MLMSKIFILTPETLLPRLYIKGLCKMVGALKESFAGKESNWIKEPAQAAANFEDVIYVQAVLEAIRKSTETKSWHVYYAKRNKARLLRVFFNFNHKEHFKGSSGARGVQVQLRLLDGRQEHSSATTNINGAFSFTPKWHFEKAKNIVVGKEGNKELPINALSGFDVGGRFETTNDLDSMMI
uniref:Uncharacterized protein n=1 Tax=Glossina austeni TaxID=7395 RepID=A0A1A9UDJ7_GLOAU